MAGLQVVTPATLSKYAMTFLQYATLWVLQEGRCALCRSTGKLHVDHDHDTGRVRGLLCQNCNFRAGSNDADCAAFGRLMIAYAESTFDGRAL